MTPKQRLIEVLRASAYDYPVGRPFPYFVFMRSETAGRFTCARCIYAFGYDYHNFEVNAQSGRNVRLVRQYGQQLIVPVCPNCDCTLDVPAGKLVGKDLMDDSVKKLGRARVRKLFCIDPNGDEVEHILAQAALRWDRQQAPAEQDYEDYEHENDDEPVPWPVPDDREDTVTGAPARRRDNA